ncbi:hypothetical protein [Agromyces italicus]|uniref:hypothetical protein n=1 Tax=Agromyces italicus TaxID=279572 RepID=UPI0003B51851|nr:hypothetical protein [Agromyces italicus]
MSEQRRDLDDELERGNEPGDPPEPSSPAEPPYQAVAPNLDRLSRDSLKPGTISRRRIGRAAIGLVIVLAVVGAIIVWTLVA